VIGARLIRTPGGRYAGIMTITRRTMLGLMAGAAILAALPAFAAERIPFDRSAFDAALKSGKPVLVDVSATWCVTCKAQNNVLATLMKKPEFSAFTTFVVDYDTGKDVMQSFGVRDRSTLIAFRNGAEVSRLSWETSEASIAGLLGKAL
jgi:thiol-disulfide isomerase/thioredoxin